MSNSAKISERYNKFKKQMQESGQLPRGYQSTAERVKAIKVRRGIASGEIDLNEVVTGLNSRIDSWGKGVQQLSDDYNARFGESYDRSVYRSDSSSWLDDVTGRRNQSDTEAEEIKSLMRVYGEYLNDDYVKSVSDYFDGNKDFFDGVIEHATIDNDYWSQWGSEEEYNYYLKDIPFFEALQSGDIEGAEKILGELSKGVSGGDYGPMPDGSVTGRYDQIDQYKNTLDYYKQRQEALDYDVAAGEAELETLKKEAEQFELGFLEGAANRAFNLFTLGLNKAGAPFSDKDAKHSQLMSEIDQKQAQHNQMLAARDFYSATSNADFDKYLSQGLQLIDPEMFDTPNGWETFLAKVDLRKNSFLGPELESLMGESTSVYAHLTNDELKVYAYYLAKYGEEKAQEYLEHMRDSLEQREQMFLDQKIYEYDYDRIP